MIDLFKIATMKIFKSIFYMAVICPFLLISCGKDESEPDVNQPKITTKEITNLKATAASSGGLIESTGLSAVTQRGVCWSKTPSPTIENSSTSNGTGAGTFVSKLKGLEPLTKYYIRAYLINAEGIYYGNEISFETPEVIVPASDYWKIENEVFVVNILGGVWNASSRALGAISSDNAVITLIFKEKPSENKIYTVVDATSYNQSSLNENQCTVAVVSGSDIYASTSNESNKLTISVSESKIKADFSNLEMQYKIGTEVKTVLTSGNINEK